MELNISIEKQEIFIKSIIWNTVIEVFKDKKKIDITKYMVSIQLRKQNIIIKTNKPIINTEALIMDNYIKKLFSKKLKKIGINFDNYQLIYK